MKLTGAYAVILTGLLQAVHADFEIYRVGIGGNGVTGNAEGWQVYQDEANCDNTLEWIWRDSDDVSGGKYGARCEGGGCGRSESDDPANIDILEMNFNSDDRHWTYYKDREGGLYDLSDNRVGNCFAWPAAALDCGITVARVVGYRKLRCVIGVTADEINAGRPSKKRSMRHVAA